MSARQRTDNVCALTSPSSQRILALRRSLPHWHTLQLHKDNPDAPGTQDFLVALMTQLEVDKKALPTYTTEDAKEFVKKFAMGIFKVADDQDRAGTANKYERRARGEGEIEGVGARAGVWLRRIKRTTARDGERRRKNVRDREAEAEIAGDGARD